MAFLDVLYMYETVMMRKQCITVTVTFA